MAQVSYSEALSFLDQTRTKKEFAEHFGLTFIEAWHYLQGMVKRKDVDMLRVKTGTVGRCFIYKKKEGVFD